MARLHYTEREKAVETNTCTRLHVNKYIYTKQNTQTQIGKIGALSALQTNPNTQIQRGKIGAVLARLHYTEREGSPNQRTPLSLFD